MDMAMATSELCQLAYGRIIAIYVYFSCWLLAPGGKGKGREGLEKKTW